MNVRVRDGNSDSTGKLDFYGGNDIRLDEVGKDVWKNDGAISMPGGPGIRS